MQQHLRHNQELFSCLLRKHEVGRFPRRLSKIDKPVISCCGSDEVLSERFSVFVFFLNPTLWQIVARFLGKSTHMYNLDVYFLVLWFTRIEMIK